MPHLVGHDRSVTLLLPESLDDYVGPENPVRFIETFLGCLASGVIAVPVAVPSARNVEAVAAIARNSGAKFVLAGEKEHRLREAISERTASRAACCSIGGPLMTLRFWIEPVLEIVACNTTVP